MKKRILYIQYSNPAAYPPIEHSSTILADAGWHVVLLGIETLGTEPLNLPKHKNIQLLRMPCCSPGIKQKMQYLSFLLRVALWAIKWKPNWIYASDVFSCLPAYVVSFLPGIKILYHEHDTPDDKQRSIFMRVCMLSRRLLAMRCRYCVLPNEMRGQHMVKVTGINNNKLLCVWNCPLLKDTTSTHKKSENDNIWILYQGSIGPDRLPLVIIEALSQLRIQIKLRVVGYETIGSIGYVSKFINYARELGVADRIEFLGPLPRAIMLDYCKKSDIGLALISPGVGSINMKYMTGASNKPFDYMACGLALLVSDLVDWKEMYVHPGYALACNPNSAQSIADAISWYAQDKDRIREMGEQGRIRIAAEWNYERQFAPVLQRLNDGCQSG